MFILEFPVILHRLTDLYHSKHIDLGNPQGDRLYVVNQEGRLRFTVADLFDYTSHYIYLLYFERLPKDTLYFIRTHFE